MLNWIKEKLNLFNKVVKDMATSNDGESYDPARVIGYGIVTLGGLEFLILTAYVTLSKGSFDGVQFSVGLTGVAGAIAAAAVGVYIKKSAEPQVATTVTTTTTSLPEGQVDETVSTTK